MSSKIRSYTLNLLALREHSRFELQHKLRNKGFAPDEIAKLLQELISKNLQSDDRFTECYINMRRSRGFGPLRIKSELDARGINHETIVKFLDENDDTWLDLAKVIHNKKFGQNPPRNLQSKAKQMKYLYYKGFTSDQIKKTIESK